MFKVGQVVLVKVEEVTSMDNGRGHRNVKLSMDPADLHRNYKASKMAEGLVMVGAVKSEEDNGWEVDLGVKKVAAFLPKKELLKGFAPCKHTISFKLSSNWQCS